MKVGQGRTRGVQVASHLIAGWLTPNLLLTPSRSSLCRPSVALAAWPASFASKFPAACYHVINRRNDWSDIFKAERKTSGQDLGQAIPLNADCRMS